MGSDQLELLRGIANHAAEKFKCNIWPNGKPGMNMIDWYGDRENAIVAYFYIMQEPHEYATYPEVFVPDNKVQALWNRSPMVKEGGLVILVRWSCGTVRYISATQVRPADNRRRCLDHGDDIEERGEAVIVIPVAKMKELPR